MAAAEEPPKEPKKAETDPVVGDWTDTPPLVRYTDAVASAPVLKPEEYHDYIEQYTQPGQDNCKGWTILNG